MPIVNIMDIDKTSSAALHLHPEEGINQVGESYKVSNSRSCQYLTEFMLYVTRTPVGSTQEIPDPPHPPASSFAEIHEEAAATPTPDCFRAKPQPKR